MHHKGSSHSNQNQFMINTPSALGYKSVHFGQNPPLLGQNQTGEEVELKPHQLIFAEDLDILHQFKVAQEIQDHVDPLGDGKFPFFSNCLISFGLQDVDWS